MRRQFGHIVAFATLLPLVATHAANAQWEIEGSHTTASLRGVDSVGNGTVWASGSDGTVLRSLDNGHLWQTCTTPPGAEKLDFRGVQAFDQNTAIVMSSGPGDQSRLYKTTDGCKTWKLVFPNPDAKGFFDSMRKVTGRQLYLLGDPVDGKFAMFFSQDSGSTWFIADDPGLDAKTGDSAFAASNSALASSGPFLFFGTGGGSAARVFRTVSQCEPAAPASCSMAWVKSDTPLASGSPASGVFSLASRTITSIKGKLAVIAVAVGGAYDKPDASAATAATSLDGGEHWAASTSAPHGYRSAVAFDRTTQTWITVGPNGTDISTDDGKNWLALRPSPADAPDADKNWNALSLPFVVGPHGRIGRLRPLTPSPAAQSHTAP